MQRMPGQRHFAFAAEKYREAAEPGVEPGVQNELGKPCSNKSNNPEFA